MIRIAEYPGINTGALVAVRRKGHTLYLEVMEVSAASHLAPHYPMSAEAPRIYGDYSRNASKSAWLHWIANRIDNQIEVALADDVEVRRYIEANLDCIPELA